jgi:C4-dicarboxylate-specific signal transduction histidine kinase
LPDTDNFAVSSGAYVNAWVEATSERQALAVASREVKEAGWRIESLEAVHPTVRDDYADDDSGLEYFEQALIDGIVLVFHSWQEGTQH